MRIPALLRPGCALVLLGILCAGGCRDAPPLPEITTWIDRVQPDILKRHVEALTDIGPRPGGLSVATSQTVAYIQTELRAYGYHPRSEAIDTSLSGVHVNILAERPGYAAPEKIIELGAHYDSVEQSPGADDNASGVAALLEIARIFSRLETDQTVRFCFFGLEENGIEGSRSHVKKATGRAEQIRGAIIFEMIGYTSDLPDSQSTPARIPFLFSPPTTGNFIAVVGNLASGGLGNRFETAIHRYVPELHYFSANRVGGFFKDALRSDHRYYWEHGISAIMLTDTADFRNPHYHRKTDTASTLDYTFLRRVTQSAAATVHEWIHPRGRASGLDQSRQSRINGAETAPRQ